MVQEHKIEFIFPMGGRDQLESLTHTFHSREMCRCYKTSREKQGLISIFWPAKEFWSHLVYFRSEEAKALCSKEEVHRAGSLENRAIGCSFICQTPTLDPVQQLMSYGATAFSYLG